MSHAHAPQDLVPDPEALAVLQPSRSRRRRWLVGAAVLAALGVGGLLLVTRHGPTTWETATVEPGTLVNTVTAVGQLEPLVSVEVGSDLSGTVLSVAVDTNDRVVAGQELARIDPTKFQTTVTQQEAGWLAAKAAVEQASVNLKAAKTTLDRTERLEARGAASPVDVEDAQVKVDVATASLASAKAQLAQAAASLEKARQDLSDTVITSPIDGVVVRRDVDPGQTVVSALQATSLFEVASDLAEMKAQVDVDEADVAHVAAGQPVTFTVTAWPGRTFDATVASVDLAPDTTGGVVTYGTELRISNDDLALRSGMTATAEIEVGSVDDALLVPTEALRFRPDGVTAPKDAHVWTLTDSQPTAVPVTVVGTDATHTAVTGEGVVAGLVVLTGSSE